jgi:hypothetical protein
MMGRYVTVHAFDSPPDDALTQALALTDRLRLVRGEEHPELWISWDHFQTAEASLASALAAGEVRSAALLPALPPPEQRWMLTEWPGQLAVAGAVADQLDPRFWASLASYELVGMRTFAPAGEPDPALTPPGTASGYRRAEWVETTAEYRASLDTGRPTAITAPVQQVMTRMRDWFGDFADERVGGAIALLSLSGVTPSTRGQAVLRNPAALGLRRVTGRTTLAALGPPGRVTVQAWGTSSPDPTRRLDGPAPRYLRRESRSLTAQLRGQLEATGAPYGVLVSLTAQEDLEVLIETGLVFEQRVFNRVQNLAIAAGKVVGATAAASVAQALPAWCLNRRLSPPSGQPLRPTPLVLSLTANIDQGTVWNIVERAPHDFGARA